MALIHENDLKRQIKEKQMNNCYLFFGEEDYLKQFYIKKICARFVIPGSETFSLRKFDGKENSFDDVFEGALSMPFMSDYTVVIAHDFPLDSLNAEQKEQLGGFLDNQPDSSITIFWMDCISLSPKNAKHKWVVDAFSKKACAVDFAKYTRNGLCKTVRGYAAKMGCEMSNESANYLIEIAGDSLNILLNETQKAAFFAGRGNEITKACIDEVAVRSLEARVYDLSKFILNGDAKGALELLHALMQNKAEPIDVFAVILMSFVDIYRAKTAISGGQTANYPAEFFDYKNKEFRLTNGARFAARLSDSQIRECFDCFSESDRLLKSTAQSGETVLERLIVKLSLILAR